MLSYILKYLIEKLQTQQYLEEVKGLAYTIKRDGSKLTGYWQAGELQPINFDNYGSLAFFIQNGNVNRTTTENDFRACAYNIKEVYSLSVILYKQGAEDVNCESEAQKIAWYINRILTGPHEELRAETGLNFVYMAGKSTNLDKNAIYEKLFNGDSPLTEDDTLIEISFDVEIEGEERCFVQYPCAVVVQGDSSENTAFGTDETTNTETINGN